MVTFEDAGLACTIDAVNDGEDLSGAAWNGRSPGSPELKLVHNRVVGFAADPQGTPSSSHSARRIIDRATRSSEHGA